MQFNIATIAKALVEILKLAPRYFAAIGIFAGALIYLPREFLERLGVAEFAQDYRPWLGIVVLAVASLAIAGLVAKSFGKLRVAWKRRNADRRVTDRLHSLTEDEKQVLRFYIAKQTRTNYLRLNDGVVQGLVAAGIIDRASPFEYVIKGVPHNLVEIAWNYLNVYPGLLDGTTNTYRSDEHPNF